MWVSNFESRMRKQNESIAELRDDIRGIAQRAYSDLDHEARKILSLDQLYKSVSNKCISKNCTSVTKAVSIIEIYEGILGENPSKTGPSKLVRQATGEQDKIRMLRKVPTTVEMTIIYRASSDKFKTA